MLRENAQVNKWMSVCFFAANKEHEQNNEGCKEANDKGAGPAKACTFVNGKNQACKTGSQSKPAGDIKLLGCGFMALTNSNHTQDKCHNEQR